MTKTEELQQMIIAELENMNTEQKLELLFYIKKLESEK